MPGIFDLRLGAWEQALRNVDHVDAAIVDGPYSERVHDGNEDIPGAPTTPLGYECMSPDQIKAWVERWSPRVRGWVVQITSHDLWPLWAQELERAGRYVFHPIPLIDRGMTVRRQGDGPSSWAVWLCVARPKTKAMAGWGTLPGAYEREAGDPRSKRRGGKPLGVMRQIVQDYSRPGDLVLDTHAGEGTTGIASLLEGRRFVGAEVAEDAWKGAYRRCQAVMGG